MLGHLHFLDSIMMAMCSTGYCFTCRGSFTGAMHASRCGPNCPEQWEADNGHTVGFSDQPTPRTACNQPSQSRQTCWPLTLACLPMGHGLLSMLNEMPWPLTHFTLPSLSLVPLRSRPNSLVMLTSKWLSYPWRLHCQNTSVHIQNISNGFWKGFIYRQD